MKKTRSLKMIRKIAVMALVLALGFPSYASETPDESDVQEIQQEIDNQQQEIDKTQQEIDAVSYTHLISSQECPGRALRLP